MRFACPVALVASAFAVASALTGCSAAPITYGCVPECSAAFTCDTNTGTCVPAGARPDMSVAIGDLAAACNPACSGQTPYCDNAHRCVACLDDTHCPLGSICKTSALGAGCVPGCTDSARCPTTDGGVASQCCKGQCTNTTNDVNNCGACGTTCQANHAEPSCAASTCKAGACAAGWGDCNNDGKDGCETNLHVDAANCTACGMACAFDNAIAGCSDGCYLKACKFGFDNCDSDDKNGCETSVLTDPNHCGSCTTSCTAPPHAKASCANAFCAVTSCDVGWTDCDNNGANGCEAHTGNDAMNCGKCGNVCGNNLVCVNGGCTCPQCNIPNAKTACINNQCVLDSCLPGYDDCNKNAADGCEVYLGGDAKNCGKCGTACPMAMPFCSQSQCTLLNNKVLIAFATSDPAWATDVQSRLQGTGDFAAVDLFNAGSGTPTLQQLQPYGSILVFSDGAFADPATLGNNVADYYDGGGQVIIAVFANASVPIGGRFGTVGNGYMLINPAGQEEPQDQLGVIADPQNPLVAGLTTLTCSACFRSTGQPINGGVTVASWQSGAPLVVRGVVKGRNRADLNFYPPSSSSRNDFWSGDGGKLLRNALLYR